MERIVRKKNLENTICFTYLIRKNLKNTICFTYLIRKNLENRVCFTYLIRKKPKKYNMLLILDQK